METTETITAYGHKNILATHKTTLEITKEAELSRRGNCIVAVSADKASADLSQEFKSSLRKDDSKLTILIKAGNVSDVVNAFGSSKLIFTHPTDIVVRKSNYLCSRTLSIQADKAACDLAKELVDRLKNPKQKVNISLIVKV
jgi:hypothetical protein